MKITQNPCKEYSSSVIKEIRKQYFLFLAQNNPYSAILKSEYNLSVNNSKNITKSQHSNPVATNTCKKYFNTILDDIIKKCFLFSVQNNPYPELFNNTYDLSAVYSDSVKNDKDLNCITQTKSTDEQNLTYLPYSQNAIKGSVADSSKRVILIDQFFLNSKQQISSLCLIDTACNLYKKTSLSDKIDIYTAKKLLPSDNNKVFQSTLFYNSKFYITLENLLIVVDQQLKIEQIHTNFYIKECECLFVSGDRLFMACSGFDSILVFDLTSENFIEGYNIRHNRTANCIYIAPFNPDSPKGPSPRNCIGLRNIFIKKNRLYFSCSKYNHLFYVEENGAIHFSTPIPSETDFVKPYKEGLLIENSAEQSIDYISMNGDRLQSFLIDTSLTDIHHLKEIIITDDELIVLLFSPSTLSVYQSDKTTPVKTVNLSKQIEVL